MKAGGQAPAIPSTMTEASTWNLSVTGKTASTLTASQVLNNKLVFTFTALDANGNEVTP